MTIRVRISDRHERKHKSNRSADLANLHHLKPEKIVKPLSLCFMNVRSAERMSLIHDHIISHDCDMIGLTETWLAETEKDLPHLQLLTLPGYQLHHIPRSTRQWGGGVGLLSRSIVKAAMLPALDVQSFESLQMWLTHREQTMTLIVLYRPPPSSVICLKTSMFFDDFSSLLESHITTPGDLIIIGAFNIHYEATNDPLIARFNQINPFCVQYNPTCQGSHVCSWPYS